MQSQEERNKEIERVKQWIDQRRAELEAGAAKKPIDKPVVKPVDKSTDKLADKSADNVIEEVDETLKHVYEQIHFEKERVKSFATNTSDYARAKLRLDYLTALPWKPAPFEAIDVRRAKKVLGQEHFGLSAVKDEIIEYIYSLNKMGKMNNEALLLVGPPGTGKTTIARQIARALDRDFAKISLGGLADEVFLRGSSTQFANSKPGALVDVLYKTKHRKLVILLDEVDKLGTRNNGNEGASALLDALDADSFFVDRFINIPISMKDIIFIATANSTAGIPSPLLDRFNDIKISPYSKRDKLEIVKKHLLPRAKASYGLAGLLRIEEAVLHQIVDEDSDNAGIRGIDKKVRKICKMAARVIEEREHQTPKGAKGAKAYTLTYKRAIESRLIAPVQKHYITTYTAGKVVASGIDLLSGRESLVSVESIFAESLKDHDILSNKKSQYKDDMTQLTAFLSANKQFFGLEEAWGQGGAFVTNMAGFDHYRYDANHKLAMFMALYSALSGVILPHNHAVIGDVTLLGEVRANALTLSHIHNAINRGVKVLFIPNDVDDSLFAYLKGHGMTLFKVAHLSQTLDVFNRLRVLNRINDRVTPQAQIHQAPLDRLLAYEGDMLKQTQCLSVPTAEEALAKLIGLENVKSVLQSIVAWKSFTQKRTAMGLASKNIGLHMAFTGNPGTGKTTVAKLFGQTLYQKKLTQTDTFIQVTRDDLVGKYIGHTEEKVRSVIKQALGGILYIDEAHSLFVGSENDFGRLVISTLVKEMEDHRHNLIVLLSGYKAEMTEMIRINPGLKDRINFKIHFDDYNPAQLVAIFLALCEEEGYVLAPEDVEALESVFADHLTSIKGTKKTTGEFSNGRFARNLFEKAKMQQALRLGEAEASIDNYTTLRLEDLLAAYAEEVEAAPFEERIMGF